MGASSVVGVVLVAGLALAGCGQGGAPAAAPAPEAVTEPAPGSGGTDSGAVAAVRAGVAGWTPEDARFPLPAVEDLSGVIPAHAVEVSADGTVLTVAFVGAGGPATVLCGEDYVGHAVPGPVAVGLVVERLDASGGVDVPPGTACSDVGYPREVEVVLPEPLGERTVVGLDGTPVMVVPAAAPCTQHWIADMIADFSGAPDPEGALADWLALDPSAPTAPAADTPRDGWLREGGGGPDDGSSAEVVFVSGDHRATASRSTRGEWVVTSVGCTAQDGTGG